MIIPIVGKNDETLGTASVKRVGKGARDFTVEFYLRPHVSLQNDAKARLTRDLITMAADQERQAD